MIVDKKTLLEQDEVSALNAQAESSGTVTMDVTYDTNPLVEVFKSIKTILSGILKDPDDAASGPLFKTIKVDNGQIERIKNNKLNEEYGWAFPAVFVHFIDVRYLVSQERIGEGRCVARIHFILNRLNNSDDEYELEGYQIFQRVNVALQTNKSKFNALTERFQLQYFDQPLSFDDALQPYWIDYEVWFKDYTAYRKKDYVLVYMVVPPFTNHSDQEESSNVNKHKDHPTPTIEDAAGFSSSSET